MSQARPLLPFVPLPWPLPALLAWAGGWACWQAALAAGAPAGAAWLAGALAGAALAWRCAGPWRRALAGLGFPLATLALGGLPGWPAWAWLLLAAALALLYPLGAWRDAPFFPTPATALQGLNALPGLAAPARVLDAGSGLGHGLRALRGQWPQARFSGLERSRPLRLLCAWRCPWADVRGGDMWRCSWAGNDVVYLFQRPESMARALAKAQQELQHGSWLLSLEFQVPGVVPHASLQGPGQRPLWAYRIGVAPPPGPTACNLPSTPPDPRR
jgi:hypothetical protein